MTVVTGAAKRAASTPVATSALKSRAPSMWTGRPSAAAATTASSGAEAPGHAARGHVGLLHADDARARGSGATPPRWPTRRRHATMVPSVSSTAMDLDPGVGGRRAGLVDDDVLAPARDGQAPGRAQDAQGHLVGHGPRRDVHRRGLAHALGVGLLELVDGGVVPVAVVAHLGLGHGPAHLGRGPGDGVAAEVDEARPPGRSGRRGHGVDATDDRLRLPVVGGAGARPGPRRRSVGVGQLGVDRRHPGEELAGPGDVAGPLVQIGQDVPLAEVAVAGIAEVAGRRRRWRAPRWPRRASPTSARSSARTSRPSTRTSADGDDAAQLLPEGLDPTVVPHGAVAVHEHRDLAGVAARQLARRVEVPDGLAPTAEAVADEAVQLSGGRGLGDLVDELAGDAQRLGIAVALVGPRRRGQAVGHLAGLGAPDRAGDLVRRPRWGGPRRISGAVGEGRRSVAARGSGCAPVRAPGPPTAVGSSVATPSKTQISSVHCGRGWPWADRAASRSLSGPWSPSSPSSRAPLRATLPHPRPAPGSGGGRRSALGRSGRGAPSGRRSCAIWARRSRRSPSERGCLGGRGLSAVGCRSRRGRVELVGRPRRVGRLGSVGRRRSPAARLASPSRSPVGRSAGVPSGPLRRGRTPPGPAFGRAAGGRPSRVGAAWPRGRRRRRVGAWRPAPGSTSTRRSVAGPARPSRSASGFVARGPPWPA